MIVTPLAETEPRPLDGWSPDIAYAFSVARTLRSGYSGPCLRVRRATDNAEQDIGFVYGRLDTAALLAFCGASAGYVTTVYAQRPFIENLVQPDPTKQPRICANGRVDSLHGKPAMLFENASQRFLAPYRMAQSITSVRSGGVASQASSPAIPLSVPVNGSDPSSYRQIAWAPELGRLVMLAAAVAVAGTSRSAYSNDGGLSWTPVPTIDDSIAWPGLAWSSQLSLFVAVAANTAMVSADGLSWTAAATVPAGGWTAVAWSPQLERFAAVGGNSVMISSDGLNWTLGVPDPTGVGDWSHIVWAASATAAAVFVVVSGSTLVGKHVMLSPDGIAWTAYSGPTLMDSVAFRRVVWCAAIGVLVAIPFNQPYVFTSADGGMTWTSRALPGGSSVVGEIQVRGGSSAAWSPDLGIVMIVPTNIDGVIVSRNGQDWTCVDGVISFGSSNSVWASQFGSFVTPGVGSIFPTRIWSPPAAASLTYAPPSAPARVSELIAWSAAATGPDAALVRSLGSYYSTTALGMRAVRGVAPVRPLDGWSSSIEYAFSVARKLASGYAGPCLRVRRSSDNAEQDIGFVLGKLDVSGLLAFCGSSAAYVTTLYAQQPFVANMVQPSPALQPRLCAAGGSLETLAGKPAMLFENSQQRMEAPYKYTTSYAAARTGGLATTDPTPTAIPTFTTVPVGSTTSSWRSLKWAPELGRVVALAIAGTGPRAAYSDDLGATWTLVPTINDAYRWDGLDWSPLLRLFVAVSRSSAIMTSPDGIVWTARTPPAVSEWRTVAWSPQLELFAAASVYPNQVMSSPNGVTWTLRSSDLTTRGWWGWMVWAAAPINLFVVVSEFNVGAGKAVMTSPDGINWTGRSGTSRMNANTMRKIIWAAELGLLIAPLFGNTGARFAFTSPDGINWTDRESPVTHGQAIAWSPALGLVLSSSNTSRNGIDWTYTQNPTFTLVPGGTDLIWVQDRFIMGGTGAMALWSPPAASALTYAPPTSPTRVSEVVAFSTTAAPPTALLATMRTAARLAPGGSRVRTTAAHWRPTALRMESLALSAASQTLLLGPRVQRSWLSPVALARAAPVPWIPTSPDGFVWAATSNPASAGIAWSPELARLVGVGNGTAATSPDGVTWTPQTVPNQNWQGVAWSASLMLFCAVSNSATGIMSSPDGVTWTLQTTPQADFRSIAWSPALGIFLAVGTSGAFMTSTNGTSWSLGTPPAGPPDWSAVIWVPDIGTGTFVALAPSGSPTVALSTDGVAWTGGTGLVGDDQQQWQNVAYSPTLNMLLTVAGTGEGVLGRSTDGGATWTLATTGYTGSGAYSWSVGWSPFHERFIIVYHDAFATSSDGYTWSITPRPRDWLGISQYVLWVSALQRFVGANLYTVPATGTTAYSLAWKDFVATTPPPSILSNDLVFARAQAQYLQLGSLFGNTRIIPTSLALPAGALTAVVYAKCTDLAAAGDPFLTLGTTDATLGLLDTIVLERVGTSFEASYTNGTDLAGTVLSSTNTITQDQWIVCILRVDTTTLRLHTRVAGTPLTSAGQAVPLAPLAPRTVDTVWLGRGASTYLEGGMRFAALYDRVLTDTELVVLTDALF